MLSSGCQAGPLHPPQHRDPSAGILHAYREDRQTYVIIDYVHGALLGDLWKRVSTEERAVIFSELRDHVCQLRRLPLPQDACIGEGPSAARASLMRGSWHRCTPRWRSCSECQLCASPRTCGHRIVFTYSDLDLNNVIMRDGHTNAVIDWEFAGWYPEHWDFSRFFGWHGRWLDRL
jgi:aminoglycoside phosphotransferase (APT) family kinase protein